MTDRKWRTDGQKIYKRIEIRPNGCWEWQGSVSAQYGYARVGEKTYRVNRLSWMLANNREVREGYCICHTCDNPICINPKHLWEGTRSENMRDMGRKGRNSLQRYPELQKYGEDSHLAKLKASDVQKIRALVASGEHTQKEIGKIYGICQQHVSDLIRRRRWAHVK